MGHIFYSNNNMPNQNKKKKMIKKTSSYLKLKQQRKLAVFYFPGLSNRFSKMDPPGYFSLVKRQPMKMTFCFLVSLFFDSIEDNRFVFIFNLLLFKNFGDPSLSPHTGTCICVYAKHIIHINWLHSITVVRLDISTVK